jgi:hypothetical protein
MSAESEQRDSISCQRHRYASYHQHIFSTAFTQDVTVSTALFNHALKSTVNFIASVQTVNLPQLTAARIHDLWLELDVWNNSSECAEALRQ